MPKPFSLITFTQVVLTISFCVSFPGGIAAQTGTAVLRTPVRACSMRMLADAAHAAVQPSANATVDATSDEPNPTTLPSDANVPQPAPAGAQSATPLGSGRPNPMTAPPAPQPFAAPRPAATAVPLIVDPPSATVQLGGISVLRTRGVFGQLNAVADTPERVSITVDQNSRTISVYGRAAGHTAITVSDQRGEHRSVDLLVAPIAGAVASNASVQITGSPASAIFIAEVAQKAALDAARLQPGAIASVASDITTKSLDIDQTRDVYVPITVSGQGLYPVNAATVVHVRNVAEPPVPPASLIVSDFPERLTASGLLFSGSLEGQRPARLLFYHYNPKGQPDRHIVLRVTNKRTKAATVQMTLGHGGPSGNEMMVGHLATERFLVRALQNEGVLQTIPAQSTVTLVDAPLPPGNIVNDILQLREIDGEHLDYTLSAEDSSTGPITGDTSNYLTANEHHARGIYPIPQFFYESTYRVGAPPVSIPVGQLPLPNMRVGEALAGDYGVQMTIDASLVNTTNAAAPVAIYANPRGGRATGTFIIDRALVRAHALPSFSTYKIRQYLVPAHGVVNVQIITMPEGGSSYPLELQFGPDDGTVPPSAPGSPIY